MFTKTKHIHVIQNSKSNRIDSNRIKSSSNEKNMLNRIDKKRRLESIELANSEWIALDRVGL